MLSLHYRRVISRNQVSGETEVTTSWCPRLRWDFFTRSVIEKVSSQKRRVQRGNNDDEPSFILSDRLRRQKRLKTHVMTQNFDSLGNDWSLISSSLCHRRFHLHTDFLLESFCPSSKSHHLDSCIKFKWKSQTRDEPIWSYFWLGLLLDSFYGLLYSQTQVIWPWL